MGRRLTLALVVMVMVVVCRMDKPDRKAYNLAMRACAQVRRQGTVSKRLWLAGMYSAVESRVAVVAGGTVGGGNAATADYAEARRGARRLELQHRHELVLASR